MMGRTAFAAGKELADNPWPLESEEHQRWDDGWLDALAHSPPPLPE